MGSAPVTSVGSVKVLWTTNSSGSRPVLCSLNEMPELQVVAAMWSLAHRHRLYGSAVLLPSPRHCTHSTYLKCLSSKKTDTLKYSSAVASFKGLLASHASSRKNLSTVWQCEAACERVVLRVAYTYTLTHHGLHASLEAPWPTYCLKCLDSH